MTLDEDDLLALVERTRETADGREIAAVVDEVLRARRATRYEPARTTMMLMAAAIAGELTHDIDHSKPEGRERIARDAVALAFEVEKATPRP